ncbi:MAG: hypothetical protein U0T81_01580 [Saprospiraceae bacterium]
MAYWLSLKVFDAQGSPHYSVETIFCDPHFSSGILDKMLKLESNGIRLFENSLVATNIIWKVIRVFFSVCRIRRFS